MIKKISKYILLFNCFLITAQTIKVSENKYVSVVLKSNIIQGAVGNEEFIIEYNTDGTEKIALIKALKKNAKETNLIIKTENNILYNVNVVYDTDVLNIVSLKESDGIDLTSPEMKSPKKEHEDNVKKSIRENDYTIGNKVINDAENNSFECAYCKKILDLGKYVKRINSDNYNIKLDLENISYYDNKIYVSINIINSSNIDYNINYIKSYIKQSKEKKSSNQYLEKNPIGIYNSNRVIKGGEERKMIFIYDQFTIDKNKHLVFELNEANGERNQSLHIPNYIVNNPLKIE